MGQTLTPLPGAYAICRLPRAAAVAPPADPADLWSLTRTVDETSIVCRAHRAPDGAQVDQPWTAFRLEGPFDLQGATGIISSVAAPLADAAISVFAMATYDTDYVLVPAASAGHARRALVTGGHTVGSLPVRIRPFEPGDADRIALLVWEAFVAYRAFATAFDPVDPRMGAEIVGDRCAGPGAQAFVAEGGTGSLLGVGALDTGDEPGLGQVWMLFVDPGHHGTGLAAALHERLLDAAHAAGLERLQLYAADGAAQARAFYARRGWVPAPDGKDGPPGLAVTRLVRDV